jgi:hypothetical protein
LWKGDIAEIAVFPGVLSAQNITSLHNYANVKYAIY